MTAGALDSVLLVALAAVIAPIVADRVRRWVPVPATVLEICAGIVLGPAALGLVAIDPLVDGVANFGLAFLFFLAGYEINFTRIRGTPLRRAAVSWGGSLLLGLAAGALLRLLLGGPAPAALVLGLALATTALGTILPMVRDTGALRTALGARVMAVGAVGEFAPIVMVAVLLGHERPLRDSALLLAFLAVAAGAARLAMRPRSPRLARLLTATLGTSAQLAVRICVLLVLAMVWLATVLHLDLVLGAFAAGIVIKLTLASMSAPETATVESKLEGIGYGMVVPFFFVTTGVEFDLPALVRSPAALALVPVGLIGFLLVRGLPVALAFRRQLPRRELTRLVLYGSTALPMVVVITSIGVTNGWISSATAAGLVGAAMLSVLLFPTLAQPRPAAAVAAGTRSGPASTGPATPPDPPTRPGSASGTG